MGVLRGRVETGVGDFARWIEKLNDHYHRITGLRLFPGTLNVRLVTIFRPVWRWGSSSAWSSSLD